MKYLELDNNRVFCHAMGHWAVKSHIDVGRGIDAVVGYNPESTLYPEYLPRLTGRTTINADGGAEDEVVFDIFTGRCSWYIFERVLRN